MKQNSAYLSIDVGTTHSKAALFLGDGTMVGLALCKAITVRKGEQVLFDPEQMWTDISGLIRGLANKVGDWTIQGIGITSMAESGLLVGRRSGCVKSPFIPWFSPVTEPQIKQIQAHSDPVERFIATGLKPSFKFGLPKLLWIKEHMPESFREDEPVWLSASDYIAYKLTGVLATDPSLAARTYAYRIDSKGWDTDWVREFGFQSHLFPDVHPAGDKVGLVKKDCAQALGLPPKLPVVIAGHDHVAAALAAGVVKQGSAMDSMGTAETYVGMLRERRLTRKDYESGFSFGLHLLPDTMFWMGSIPASGGSVEWLRSVIADSALEYEEMSLMLDSQEPKPTGLLFYPHLSGSGAFVGLRAAHGKGHLLKAVLEGTAYEMELIRESAERITGCAPDSVTVVGGGAKNSHWLQIKADVSGVILHVPDQRESALLGAAMITAAGVGMYSNIEEAQASMTKASSKAEIIPNHINHELYKQLYLDKYKPLRTFIQNFTG